LIRQIIDAKPKMRQQDLRAKPLSTLCDSQADALSLQIGDRFHRGVCSNDDLRWCGICDGQCRDGITAMAKNLVCFHGVEREEVEC
jgi:hypothetical protein